MHKLYLILFACFYVATSSLHAAETTGIQWSDANLEHAKNEKRFVILDLHC